MWCIYKHTNKINGKVYIGQTCALPEQRWRGGEGYNQQVVFYRAIQKYGWDNFEHEILETNLASAAEADLKEKEYIRLYHSCIYDSECNGYNMTWGGEGTAKWSAEEVTVLEEYYKNHQEKRINLDELCSLLPNFSKDQIINKAARMNITNNPRLPWTNEENNIMIEFYPIMGTSIIEKLPNRSIEAIYQQASKLKLQFDQTNKWTPIEKDILFQYFPTEGLQKCIQLLPHRTTNAIRTMAYNLGLTMTDPNQNRIGQGHIAVMCLETGIIYNSIAAAHEATGDDKSGICECCQRKRYATHGRHYLYTSDPKCQNPKKAIEEIETQRIQNNPRNKTVRNIDTGEVFISMTEAKKKYPMATKIGEVCRGNRKTAGGYHWEYVKEGGEE